MRALITGAAGQLGSELQKTAPNGVEIIALSRDQCDITEWQAVEKAVRAAMPTVVINAAAYTAVDAAEDQPELAHAINASGAGNVARAAESAGARTIHISTDYVFDGASNTPYLPGSPTNPLNVYGVSKLAGEREVRQKSPNALIIRSGWLYASGGKNFLRAILTALKASRPLKVVSDQMGVPTAARELARAIWKCSERGDLAGVQHWVNGGTASWYEFAVAIQTLALETRLVSKRTPIIAVTSEEYGSRAVRPHYSVLDARDLWAAIGEAGEPWQDSLLKTLAEMSN